MPAPKSRQIKQYFKDGDKFGVSIEYVEEKKRLGTAGALKLIDHELSEPFFVINGDVITALNFEELRLFHEQQKAVGTMCVRECEMQIPYGVVACNKDNCIVGFQEKPMSNYLVNAGVYMLNPSVLSHIPPYEYFDMPSLFESLLSQGEITKAFEVSDYWIDIGSPGDFMDAKNKLD